MLLYHGTGENNFQSILERGILPRELLGTESKWDEYPSREDLVYLSSAYPFYFALCGLDEGEKPVVFEVEVPEENLFPDEDFIAQAVSNRTMGVNKDVHNAVRKDLDLYQHHWKDSIDKMGNCAHQGAIPHYNITRYCLFDSRARCHLAMALIDPTISIINFTFCGKKYREYVAWLFGDCPNLPDPYPEIPDDQIEGMMKDQRDFWAKESKDRTGVKVITLL